LSVPLNAFHQIRDYERCANRFRLKLLLTLEETNQFLEGTLRAFSLPPPPPPPPPSPLPYNLPPPPSTSPPFPSNFLTEEGIGYEERLSRALFWSYSQGLPKGLCELDSDETVFTIRGIGADSSTVSIESFSSPLSCQPKKERREETASSAPPPSSSPPSRPHYGTASSTFNTSFESLSRALYLAENKAREEVAARASNNRRNGAGDVPYQLNPAPPNPNQQHNNNLHLNMLDDYDLRSPASSSPGGANGAN